MIWRSIGGVERGDVANCGCWYNLYRVYEPWTPLVFMTSSFPSLCHRGYAINIRNNEHIGNKAV